MGIFIERQKMKMLNIPNQAGFAEKVFGALDTRQQGKAVKFQTI
jgi:hypothetical protein